MDIASHLYIRLFGGMEFPKMAGTGTANCIVLAPLIFSCSFDIVNIGNIYHAKTRGD